MKEEDKTKSRAKKMAITRTFLALPCHSKLVQPDTKALDKLIVSKAALVCKAFCLKKAKELLEEEVNRPILCGQYKKEACKG